MADREKVSAHLTGCERCRKLVETIDELAADPVRAVDADPMGKRAGPAAEQSGSSLMPGTRVGRYEIKGILGTGGMGTVYAAHDDTLDRMVALKLITLGEGGDDETLARFDREARLTAQLQHSNLVPVYEVGHFDGRPYMVMKLLEGQTLLALLAQRSLLTVREALPIARQLCLAVGFIHKKGMIHRDLKPGNVMLSSDGHVTVVDFGVARPASSKLTRAGFMVGTPMYMAPEQLSGAPADHRADLHALALLCFLMLCGRHPFDRKVLALTMQAVLEAQPPPATSLNSLLSPSVNEVFARALAKDPANRFQSAQELWEALELACSDSYSPTIFEADRPVDEAVTKLADPVPRSEPTLRYAGNGSLDVVTRLEGKEGSAFVEVNGARHFTPVKLTLPSGSHTVRAFRPGYLPVDRQVEVQASQTLKVIFDLVRR